MPENTEVHLWLWQEPDERFEKDVLNYIKPFIGENDLTVLCTSSLHSIDNGVHIMKYLLDLCFKFEKLENDRTTLLSYKDHLLALELSISRSKSKNEDEMCGVMNSEIIAHHKQYSQQKLSGCDNVVEMPLSLYNDFLEQSNSTDLWNLYTVLKGSLNKSHDALYEFLTGQKFLICGTIEMEVLHHIVQLLARNGQICNIVLEIPLSISLDRCTEFSPLQDSTKICEQLMPASDIPIKNSSLSLKSSTEEYVSEVILAFLCLLVNSRNELALSKAMMSPIIELSHSAFTDLKHVSLQKDMPMCQTVISYITRIRLGGKGYAPSSECPLLRHKSGLESFVDLINQLQTIVEEDNVTLSATRRIINILKNKILKCSSKSLRESSIEAAAKTLNDAVCAIYNSMKSCMSNKVQKTNANSFGQETLDVLHNLVNHMACCYDQTDPELILCEKDVKRTPLNVPPLIGYFRSPEEEEEDDNSQSSLRSLGNTTNENTQDSVPLVSYFHHSESNSASRSCLNGNTPTKTSFRNCIMGKENSNTISTEVVINKKRTFGQLIDGNKIPAKRSILDSISSGINASKKVPVKTTKKTSSKKPAKSKSQIKGQCQITKFFR